MLVETIDKITHEIEIHSDDYPCDPREFDNLGTIHCASLSKYTIGDTFFDYADFKSWDDVQAHLKKEYDARVILPVYLYDHSGLRISTQPFSCPWDSGQIGFVYVSAEKIRSEFNVKRINKSLLQEIEKIIIAEIQTYDDYISGNVYGYCIREKSTDMIASSCYGYYGNPNELCIPDALEEFKAISESQLN